MVRVASSMMGPASKTRHNTRDEYASPTALIERPVRPFTKLFVRPIAFLAFLSLEIGRNGAKFRASPVAVLSAQQLHGRQEEPT
jgi:hypothetical protein